MGQNHVPKILGRTHSNEVVTQHLLGHPAWILLQPLNFWGKPRNWTDNPKTLKEIVSYIMKNWICPVICILTVWSKKWTKTFLMKWRKRCTNPTTSTIHQQQHPHDGNPTEHTIKKPLDPNYFTKYYHKKIDNPFHMPRLRKNHK